MSGIDANSKNSSDQAFFTTYTNSLTFHGKAGEFPFRKGVLSGDTNGDKVAEFVLSITLVGGTNLAKADFILQSNSNQAHGSAWRFN
ncbi:MAG: hypothetical protein RIQ94_73 [Pseudomonadota bacterium]